tara:strand:- start:4292 stop:4516 length:225 start_codon:yes stop_codon:yes gene_type:complete
MFQHKITKFEKVRLIGTRATQISLGAPPCIDIGNLTDVIEITEKEYECGKIPLKICRELPNGKKIEIPFSDLLL